MANSPPLPPPNGGSPASAQQRTVTLLCGFSVAAAWGFCAWNEVGRLREAIGLGNPWLWCFQWDSETTPLFWLVPFVLLVAFVASRGRRSSGRRVIGGGPSVRDRPSGQDGWHSRRGFLLAVGSAILFLVGSRFTATKALPTTPGAAQPTVAFGDLPPAWHDEYSYLLQADTFLSGRWAAPECPGPPGLFHQFHVLNTPVTASRYFPTTGLWLVPFRYAALTEWAMPVAGALCVGLLVLAADAAGWSARLIPLAILLAVSPGMALFSQFILAHYPALLGLSAFLYLMVRYAQRPRGRLLFAAGGCLAWAMLARPMTAAGFALPVGIWLLFRSVLRYRAAGGRLSDRNDRRGHPLHLILMGLPLVFGFMILGWQNLTVTGDLWKSPYSAYTERYTPRHRYGFGNGEEQPGEDIPDAVRRYDEWASNLTLAGSIDNLWVRTRASAQWILGIGPLLLACLPVLVAAIVRKSRRSSKFVNGQRLQHSAPLLLWAVSGIGTLHLVHLPYWFDGIFHWHYVFETAPLWLFVAATGSTVLGRQLKAWAGSFPAGVAWAGFLIAVCGPGWLSLEEFWGTSRMDAAVSESGWARQRQADFAALRSAAVIQTPAILMVNETGTDAQLSFILNNADLDNPVLVCRKPLNPADAESLLAAYSDRRFYEAFPETGEVRAVSRKDGILQTADP